MIEFITGFELFGSDGAILAAFIGGGFVILQIWSTSRLSRRERASNFLGHKATLSQLLSKICRWSNTISEQIEDLHSHLSGHHLPPGTTIPAWENLAFAEIVEIRETIRLSDDKNLITHLYEILKRAQVLEARLESLSDSTAAHFRHNLETYLLNALEIYVLAESLFDFAREDAAAPPQEIDWTRLRQIAERRDLTQPTFQYLPAQIERRIIRSHLPTDSRIIQLRRQGGRIWHRLVIGEWPEQY